MWRAELVHRLADYGSVMRDCLLQCRPGDDRGRYLRALAFVGLLLAAINDDEPFTTLVRLVEEEDATFSWSYLSKDEGKTAEAAWATFKKYFLEARARTHAR